MKRTLDTVRPTFVAVALLIAVAISTTSESASLSPALLRQAAELDRVDRVEITEPAVDAALAEDEARRQTGVPVPLRLAVPVATELTPDNAGTWERLADGSELWRLRLGSHGARHLNLAFDRFDLPAGARLWLYNTDGAMVRGPYTKDDRNAAGGLWTPIVVGDEVVVELHLPVGASRAVDLEIGSVNYGFREFDAAGSSAATKQGTCNIDVICPEGDPWRDQIRSAARIMILGAYLCSAQLLNTTAEDGTPYLLTAQHCVEDASQAPSVVVFWNFESPECGLLAGGDLSQTQSGATLVSVWPWQQGSDFALLLLDELPDAAFNVYYSGWDASGAVPTGSVGIHHPSGDEKAISFDNDPPTKVNYYGSGSHQWRIGTWDLGTTEGGSSGSCIYDEVSKRCIGTLTAGTAACSNPTGYDIYGRMDAHWTGDGTAGGRLSDWLDPLGSGTLTLDGLDSSGVPPTGSFTYSPVSPTTGAPVSFNDTSTGNPTSWSWGFGDGGTSTERNPVHIYSSAGTFTVSLTATNANGSSTATSDITVTLSGSSMETYIIPAAALSSGLEGSFFQTDIDINNGGAATASFLLSWLPRGENNSSPTTSGIFTLAAGASVRYENVLSEVFGLEPDVVGALAISADTTELTVMSRTFNLPDVKVTGTYGQAIPGIPSSELIGQNDVRRIIFMSENDDLRSNVGCANGVDDSVPITIELYREDGALLAVETMTLAPYSNNQFNRIFEDHAPTYGYVDVSSIKASAGFFCYGSVLDNGSSDPTTILPR